MLDIVKEVLEDIGRISLILHEGDAKHGGVILFIDLLHDVSVQPTLTEDDIRKSFHDGFGWYGNQGISVVPRIIKANTSSDGFFVTGNEHYIGFPWF